MLIFVPLFTVETKTSTKSGKKIPVGGVSIFGDDGDDLFSSSKSEPKPGAPATLAPKSGGGGLFDDEDEDDLFADLAPKGKTSSAPVGKSKSFLECICFLLPRLHKFPSPCCSNRPGNLGNPGSKSRNTASSSEQVLYEFF